MKSKIVNQHCKILFSLKNRMQPERFVLEEGSGEEVYKIESVELDSGIRMNKMHFMVYNIKISFPRTGLTSIKVAYSVQLDMAYILAS